MHRLVGFSSSARLSVARPILARYGRTRQMPGHCKWMSTPTRAKPESSADSDTTNPIPVAATTPTTPVDVAQPAAPTAVTPTVNVAEPTTTATDAAAASIPSPSTTPAAAAAAASSPTPPSTATTPQPPRSSRRSPPRRPPPYPVGAGPSSSHFARYGLPFLLFIVLGSYGYAQILQPAMDQSSARNSLYGKSTPDLGGTTSKKSFEKAPKPKMRTLEEEYERSKKDWLDDFELKPVPKPPNAPKVR